MTLLHGLPRFNERTGRYPEIQDSQLVDQDPLTEGELRTKDVEHVPRFQFSQGESVKMP